MALLHKNSFQSVKSAKSVVRFLTKYGFHDGVSVPQRGAELPRVFAAGFGHIWTAAARAADFLRDGRDDLARLHARSEVFGDSDDERDFFLAIHFRRGA